MPNDPLAADHEGRAEKVGCYISSLVAARPAERISSCIGSAVRPACASEPMHELTVALPRHADVTGRRPGSSARCEATYY